jgi:hypothetical protein
MAKKRSVVSHGVAALYREVRAVLEQARAFAYLAVNFAIVHALMFPIQDALCLESGTTKESAAHLVSGAGEIRHAARDESSRSHERVLMQMEKLPTADEFMLEIERERRPIKARRAAGEEGV